MHQNRRQNRVRTAMAPKGQEKGNVINVAGPRERKPSILFRKMAPQVGFEPTTLRLTEESREIHGAISSTTEVDDQTAVIRHS
jgi:hypothetical protein